MLSPDGMKASERVGELLGALSAPLFKAMSHARHARTFHPRGDLVRVSLTALQPESAPLEALARQLAGDGLLRLSNALWKSERWPDALGCALAVVDAQGRPIQHLLMATIRRPWTMPFAPFTTRVHDYLANDYFAVSPFSAPGLPWLWLRLRPEAKSLDGAAPPPARRELLTRQVHEQRTLALEAGPGPWGPWTSFLRVTLREVLAGDPPGIEFDPFLDDRGLVPRGFVHALRRGAYEGSRKGRAPSVPAGLQPR